MVDSNVPLASVTRAAVDVPAPASPQTRSRASRMEARKAIRYRGMRRMGPTPGICAMSPTNPFVARRPASNATKAMG